MNFAEIIRRQTDLINEKTALKGVELYLLKEYDRIDSELEALQAMQDKMQETANEVSQEMSDIDA